MKIFRNISEFGVLYLAIYIVYLFIYQKAPSLVAIFICLILLYIILLKSMKAYQEKTKFIYNVLYKFIFYFGIFLLTFSITCITSYYIGENYRDKIYFIEENTPNFIIEYFGRIILSGGIFFTLIFFRKKENFWKTMKFWNLILLFFLLGSLSIAIKIGLFINNQGSGPW